MKLLREVPTTLNANSSGLWLKLSPLTRLAPVLGLALMLPMSRTGAATVGYWPLEGTPGTAASGADSVLDLSGNGLNGTPANSPIYSSDLPPWAGAIGSTSSLFYSAVGTRVFVPDAPILQLTHSLTIEASIKPEALRADGGGEGEILFRGDNRPGLDPYRLALQPGNVLYFQIGNASGQFAALSYALPSFDQWYHVAATLDDATGQMKLFVNGNMVTSTTTSVRPLATLDPAHAAGLGIGGDQDGQYALYFHGWLDGVRLSDTALDPSQFLGPVHNVPPVAIIEVSPLAQFPGYTNLIVIAPNGLNAQVTFDGSKSYDPDGTTFYYFWYEGSNLFATNALATRTLSVGSHEITLLLDDTLPQGTNSTSVTVEVITPAESIGIVMALLDNSSLARNAKRPLEATLNAAVASLERGDTRAAIYQLMAFQNKTRAQVAPFDSVLANQLIGATQTIINVLGGK